MIALTHNLSLHSLIGHRYVSIQHSSPIRRSTLEWKPPRKMLHYQGIESIK